jgi:hypothetical protein
VCVCVCVCVCIYGLMFQTFRLIPSYYSATPQRRIEPSDCGVGVMAEQVDTTLNFNLSNVYNYHTTARFPQVLHVVTAWLYFRFTGL